ncbi:bifunctional RNase H/acid phosphatase [Corynebacterium sp. H130]|uniref:bifunctional RNase H/acid phosphatase n=1 Tax=Corynebacterium sp. H130 TaxID=3133444 RepID=UPI0030B58492
MKVIIEADGGSRGNPGVAGSGTVVYSSSRDVLREIAYVVGKASNNVAEYHGLLRGLEVAAELGATEVDVYMDSKLVVEQMSGRWKIKHPDMKELALKAQQIARGFEQISYTWIPREKNKKADALSNVAMDACAAGKPVGILAEEDPEPASEKKAEATWTGAVTRPLRLLLLRHGETSMSVAKQYSGTSDPALTPRGEQMAQQAAARIASVGGIDAIVCSPLGRARQTAQYCADALGMKVDVMDELAELDFGLWEGKTFAEVISADPELHQNWLADTSVSAPGGESVQAVNRRVKKALESLKEQYPAGNVLVVSHVTPIKLLLRAALDAPTSVVNKIHLDLASLSIAEFYADGPTTIKLVNDTAHIR